MIRHTVTDPRYTALIDINNSLGKIISDCGRCWLPVIRLLFIC